MVERRLYNWGIALSWIGVLALILVGSLMPEQEGMGEQGILSQDWSLFHIPAYAVLAVVTVWFLRARRLSLYTAIGISVLFSSLLGLGIEWLQPLFGRTQSLIDFGFNEIGVLLGSTVAMVFFYPRQLLRL
ncbi:MAG: VanZ family protein [Pseudomonadota bacterium]